jgi:uncharacterized DUF497 family protein
MIPGFEWDPAKRAANLRKHGIDFVRAVQIFEGFVSQQLDTRWNYGEPRIIATGELGGSVLTVVYTPRGVSLRIISARRANAREARAYRAVRPPEAPRPD